MKRKSNDSIRQIAFLLGMIGCLILLNTTAFAQKGLKTGFYKVVAVSSLKYLDPISGDTLFLDPEAICSAGEFRKVSAGVEEVTGTATMEIQLSEEGTAKFAKATSDNIGRKIAIIGNGKLLTAPVLSSEIPGGRLTISGNFTVEEINALVDRIRKDIPGYAFRTQAQEEEERLVLKACNNLDKGLQQKDTVALKRVLHPQLSLGHSNGLIETKEGVLQHLSSGYLIYKEITEEGYTEVQFVQDVATVRRNLKVNGVLNGTTFDTRLKVLEVWITKDKEWRLLCRQSIRKQ